MTAYVDNIQIPATVQNGPRTHTSTWSHLTADTPEELHQFAAELGLQRSYFQPGHAHGGQPSVGWHYDVTRGMREKALRHGAHPIDLRGWGELLSRRRQELAQARQLASEADKAAGVAFHAGDLNEAARLIADARALDPARAERWDVLDQFVRRAASQQSAQAGTEAGQ